MLLSFSCSVCVCVRFFLGGSWVVHLFGQITMRFVSKLTNLQKGWLTCCFHVKLTERSSATPLPPPKKHICSCLPHVPTTFCENGSLFGGPSLVVVPCFPPNGVPRPNHRGRGPCPGGSSGHPWRPAAPGTAASADRRRKP